MKNLNSSGRAAVLVASLFVVGTSACDVPAQSVVAVAAEQVGTGLFSGALTTLQAPLTGLFAALAPAGVGSPPDVTALPDVQADDPSPNDVYILGVMTNGKGCPKGDPNTVATTIAEDRKSFVVNFKDMELSYPPGKTIQTTNCQADVSLHVPGGWQVSLATVTTRGLAILADKQKANQTSTYFFAGGPPQKQYHTDIVGPQEGYFYEFTDVVPLESVVWSKCGASAIFSINTSLILDTSKNPGGDAIFNSTSMDAGFEKVLQYQWRKC